MRLIKTRAELIDALAERSCSENLGLFVGTGFSKAINNETCTFEELVNVIYNSDGIHDFKKEKESRNCIFVGKSYPQIVELIEKKRSREDVLKAVVACCSLGAENVDDVKLALNKIHPQWVITTNYDLIMEQLLPNSETIGPYNAFVIHKNSIPIFHLHGHIRNSESIVISEKDYVKLLKIDEYRQQKLVSSMAESSVLFLGYSLGDINVRAAIDRANAYALEYPSEYDNKYKRFHALLQYDITSSDNDSDSVFYDGETNMFILKVKDVKNFLKDVSVRIDEKKKLFEDNLIHLKDIVQKGYLNSPKKERIPVIRKFKTAPRKYLDQSSDCLIEILKNSSAKIVSKNTLGEKRINHYECKLFVMVAIEILSNEFVLLLKPMVVYFIARIFNEITCLTESAEDAFIFWSDNKKSIPSKVLAEMNRIAKANKYKTLDECSEEFRRKSSCCVNQENDNGYLEFIVDEDFSYERN